MHPLSAAKNQGDKENQLRQKSLFNGGLHWDGKRVSRDSQAAKHHWSLAYPWDSQLTLLSCRPSILPSQYSSLPGSQQQLRKQPIFHFHPHSHHKKIPHCIIFLYDSLLPRSLSLLQVLKRVLHSCLWSHSSWWDAGLSLWTGQFPPPYLCSTWAAVPQTASPSLPDNTAASCWETPPDTPGEPRGCAGAALQTHSCP